MWPIKKRVTEVFKTDAMAIEERDLLIVHQSPNLEYKNDLGDWELKSEQDLLDYLMTCNNDGIKIVPLIGKAGSGKTHQVRWIHAKLKNYEWGTRNLTPPVIIFIEKHQTIKDAILKLIDIMEPIETEWVDIRRRLNNPQLINMKREDEIRLFCTAIVNELSGQIQQNPNNGSNGVRECFRSLYHDQLFVDKVIEDRDNIIHRIIDVTFNTYDSASTKDWDPKVDDFFYSGIRVTNQKAIDFYNMIDGQRGIQNSQFMKICLNILTSCLQPAIKQLFIHKYTHLDPVEIFTNIREKLKNQGKELYLIIEDFVKLGGFQNDFLTAISKEAVNNGELVRCNLHSLIATTEGFAYETINSRTPKQWRIYFPEDQNGDQKAIDLISRYLFASRTQREELIVNEVVQNDSLLRYHEITEEIKAFGMVSENCLYPFNEKMIKQLRKLHRLVTPREIIDKCSLLLSDCENLNKLLEKLTPQSIDPMIGVVLNQTNNNSDKIRKVIYYYGGNTKDINDKLFKAFNLDNPFARTESKSNQDDENKFKNTPGNAVAEKSGSQTQKKTVEVEEVKEVKEIEKRFKIITSWLENRNIYQEYSTDLRNLIKNSLAESIDWQAELIKYDPKYRVFEILDRIFIDSLPGLRSKSDSIIITQTQDTDLNRERAALWFNALYYKSIFQEFNPDNPVIAGRDYIFWYIKYNEFIESFRDKFLKLYKSLLKRDEIVLETVALGIVAGKIEFSDIPDNFVKIFDLQKLSNHQISTREYDFYTKFIYECTQKLDSHLIFIKNNFIARQGDGGDIIALDFAEISIILNQNLEKYLKQFLNTYAELINNTIKKLSNDIRTIQLAFGNALNAEETLMQIHSTMQILMNNLPNKNQIARNLIYLEFLNNNYLPIPAPPDLHFNLIEKTRYLSKIDFSIIENLVQLTHLCRDSYNTYTTQNQFNADMQGMVNQIETVKSDIINNLEMLLNLAKNLEGQNDNN